MYCIPSQEAILTRSTLFSHVAHGKKRDFPPASEMNEYEASPKPNAHFRRFRCSLDMEKAAKVQRLLIVISCSTLLLSTGLRIFVSLPGLINALHCELCKRRNFLLRCLIQSHLIVQQLTAILTALRVFVLP